MSDPVHLLFERMLPGALESLLAGLVGDRIPRLGPDDAFRVSSCGRFSGRIAADLLAYAKNQSMDGAFVLVQDDAYRALYVAKGTVVGAESNVLFERLGRVLLRLGQLSADDARQVVHVEESQGTAAAASMLPLDVAVVGLDRRAWEVGTALTFMGPSHFMFVDGAPRLGSLPLLSIATMDLAIEGVRRYDEWRNAGRAPAAKLNEPAATNGAELVLSPTSDVALTGAVRSAARPAVGAHDVRTDVDAIMRLLRE
jgi:hypothetical protein